MDSLELKPARHLWVGPATLEIAPGKLLAGADTPALADFAGKIDCTVHLRNTQGSSSR